jgi:hypothetical protein
MLATDQTNIWKAEFILTCQSNWGILLRKLSAHEGGFKLLWDIVHCISIETDIKLNQNLTDYYFIFLPMPILDPKDMEDL